MIFASRRLDDRIDRPSLDKSAAEEKSEPIPYAVGEKSIVHPELAMSPTMTPWDVFKGGSAVVEVKFNGSMRRDFSAEG